MKHWKIRIWLVSFLTASCVAVGYEIKGVVSLIVSLPASVFLSTISSNLLIQLALLNRLGRAIVLNGVWLEGYWLLETKGAPAWITNRAIVHIIYEESGMGLVPSVTTYRINQQNCVYPSSKSEVVTIRDFDRNFSNIFKSYPDNDSLGTRGISTGFFTTCGGIFPSEFTGEVILLEEGIPRIQRARKIPFKRVRQLSKKYSGNEEWMKNVILGVERT